MYIGQPEISARVLIRQFLVIEPQLMQNRRVQIVHVNFS